jgi:cellulose synthase/poly-beta-1,6-N-acetylglucosamine synthase-like glycosyltransferase
MGVPRFSVVIAAHNSAKTMNRCLDALARQTHDSFETIVVDDGSTDETRSVCLARSWVTLKAIEHGGPSRARNIGIAEARGEYVAFTDADCVPRPDWLKELESGFAGPRVAGVGGDQESPGDETPHGKTIQDFLKTIGFVSGYIKTSRKLRETSHNPSCNAAYRRTVLMEVGGFDEGLWPGEDVDLDYRITRRGYVLLYNPKAVVGHYRPARFSAFARMMRRYGTCQWFLIRKYGPFRVLHFEPVALLLSVIGALVFLRLRPDAAHSLLAPLPIVYSWFYLRTGDFRDAAAYLWLLVITLACWNWGFFTAPFRRANAA